MKKALLLITVSIVMIACGGVKKTQKAINTGDYYNAMNQAITNLANNKAKKSNQPYIILLEEAFKKNTKRELDQINFLADDENPANYEAIYNSYANLRSIQERIKPLLPLRIYDENRDARFSFKNYQNDIIDSKDDLSEYLYDNASDLIQNATSKYDYRKAYADFTYLEEINPGYDDVKLKIEEAHQKGLDFVLVNMINETDKIIPTRLEDELLNFNTYGLNDLWTSYHTNAIGTIEYDYEMQVAFRGISISPERINEKQIIKERQIKDGYKYLYDKDGAIVKDSLGKKIKVDKFKTVRCDFYQFTQQKSAQLTGNVSYIDLRTKQQVNTYPLASTFIFEHAYANYDGDKRALDNDLVALLDLAEVPFPNTEEMIYDAGEDLKARIKNIIARQKFDPNRNLMSR
ncbi:hypothetical protein JQC67_14985 [Aurantibacter crassamenti]|uniref:hypothetical protein n=1 Tax=Aurantibacter crassamenti TaxID=1837375 RepID=UPI00193A6B99|nr:hypothetical protein [Aurantibacter crassamenti]MBM1107457.1 hypothetical protein [Aurantibacter crassamenti]